MGKLRWVAVSVVLVAVGSCAAPSPVSSGLLYTCCDALDVTRAYRPGDTLSLHWKVVGTPGRSPVQGFELDADLTGPYATVRELKDSRSVGAGVSTFKADPIRPTGMPGEQPVSVITIPLTAVPGYYNLTTAMAGPGSAFSNGTIIQVVSAV
jgi:hypothetical protein